MKTAMSVKPDQDSYNSYPEAVDFVLYKGHDHTSIEINIGDRVLNFNADDLLSIFKTFEVVRGIK